MNSIREELLAITAGAKLASRRLSALKTRPKNELLFAMGEALLADKEAIFAANALDLQAGREAGLTDAMLDRLALDETRLCGIVCALKKIAALPDPIGLGDVWHHEKGMEIRRMRVPLGVLGIIYEARPNVTVDAAALCIKSGNAVVLRGGKEALNTNRALVKVLRATLKAHDVDENAVCLIDSADRAYTGELLTLTGELDAVIPRGGRGLIEFVKNTARVPVIETGAGNCHLYVHADADLEMALCVLINAKCSRPSVCNAVEHLLVHREAAQEFLPKMLSAMQERGVTVRVCADCRAFVPEADLVTADDFATEYNDLVLSVKLVDSLEAACDHIARYSTRHSETILTQSLSAAAEFEAAVDAAAVYVNASSRFTDGEEFGFGAEIGISTQKLHARGPMGLGELTTVKYLIRGTGQVR